MDYEVEVLRPRGRPKKSCRETDTSVMASFPRQPGSAGTTKVEPFWF